MIHGTFIFLKYVNYTQNYRSLPYLMENAPYEEARERIQTFCKQNNITQYRLNRAGNMYTFY